MDALRSRSAAAWMQLFKDRTHGNVYPYGSGVWSKKEWVVPFIDNENIVSMYEGNSNLLWADRYGKQLHVEDLWIKQCGNSHTGSFKDLGMTVLVSIVKQMMASGVPIDAVACASTGDTSAALGAYCAAAGIPAVVLLPKDKVSIAQLVQPLANGALVLSLDTDFDGCMTFEPVTAKPTLAMAIQIGNPVSVKRAIRTLQRFNGVVEQATEQELADEAARADRTGMFNCPHTGVGLAALRKLVDRKLVRANDRVVVISTANGLKFADQKAAYHMGALEGIKPTHRNKPVELPADPKRVARAIARHVDKAKLLAS